MLIYLASPYTKYPGGKLEAFDLVCEKAAELMDQGHNVFCPIAHSHPIEQTGMITDNSHGFWLKQDFAVLDRCDELWVYKMTGWQESYGVTEEIKRAQRLGIMIKYISFDYPHKEVTEVVKEWVHGSG